MDIPLICNNPGWGPILVPSISTTDPHLVATVARFGYESAIKCSNDPDACPSWDECDEYVKTDWISAAFDVLVNADNTV
jgi:hypothetical protein